MTGTELMAVVGFGVMVFGALFALWRYVEAKISTAKDKADQVAEDLASHRLHVAETYSTKSGMKEIKDEILGAVGGIRDDVRHLATRFDSMHEAQSKPRPRRQSE